jgi:RNA polymerase sigma-32 factor
MESGKKKKTKIKKSKKPGKINKNKTSIVVEVKDEDIEIEQDEEILLEPEEVIGSPQVDSAKKSQEERVNAILKKSEGKLVKYDPLKAYIQQVRHYPLLNADEEHQTAIIYQNTHDRKAAKRLITSNLRLVVKIAHEYSKVNNNLLDLIQEGNMGLIQAVEKFDPYRGVKLSTYSSWWIKAYILKYLLNNWRLVKIGTTQAQRKLFFNLHKQQDLLKSKGITPTSNQLAIALDVPEKEVKEMQKRLSSADLSLSTPVKSDDGDGKTVMDFMSNPKAKAPEEIVAADELHRLVSGKIKAFSKDLVGRDLVIMRDRLLSDEPMTLKQIGDRYGISRERARQIEKRLLKKLRAFLETELGDNVQIALGFQ